MIDNNIRNNTDAILKEFSLEIDGIDYKKAITMDVAYCYAIGRGEQYSFHRYAARLFYPLQENRFFEVFNETKILFTSWVNRRDYVELIDSIRSGLNKSSYSSINTLFSRKFTLPKKYYVDIFLAAFKCRTNIRNKFFIAFRLLDYVTIAKTLMKSPFYNILGEDYKYIPFNSSFGVENVITQLLNKHGCNTFHLCHGLHFSPNYRFFSIDAFNKELISAKTVLSWGQGFVDNDNRLYNHNYHHEVVGNPKYPYKKINIHYSTDKCVVLLARGQYDENNYKLLKLLGEYQRKYKTVFFIKPHPTDNLSNIVELAKILNLRVINNQKTVKEILSSGEYGFAISYETTSYFEAMYYNLICFRYAYEENESYGDFDNRFSSCEELKAQVDKYKNMCLENLNRKIEEALIYEIGMGIYRYPEVIK